MREELEMEVAVAVRTRIMPILKQLQGDPAFQPYRIELDMLGMHMDLLSSGMKKEANRAEALSTTELRVAALVRNNLTSGEIAGRLFISPETVKTHRRNIRKKLGIHNTRKDLVAYLRTQTSHDRSH
jgi:DNA-binding CsgD family transcriptional regulator